MTNEEEPLMLLKFGKKKHMHSLITKGEIFLNTRRFYADIEDIEIGDYWEGIDAIRQTSRISISHMNKVHWKTLALDTPVGICDNSKAKGNVYCTYGVRLNHFNEKPFLHIVPTAVTRRFGDTMVLIGKPTEFLNRIQARLAKLGHSFESRFVQYYNDKEIDGVVNPFQKRNILSHQSEYRIFVVNNIDKPIKITIGSIEDIAQIINGKMIKYVLDEKDYFVVPSREELSPNDFTWNDESQDTINTHQN